MDTTDITVSQALAALTAAGFSQRDIAAKCGCSQSHVSRLATGLRGQRLNKKLERKILRVAGKFSR